MTILSTPSANATTTETTEKTAKPKIDKKLATAALSNLTQAKRALEGKVVTKKVQKREAVLAHREEEKQAALVLLSTGSTKKWSARFALVRAVTAMKMGANSEELQGCKALMTVVDWTALEQPVRDYAVAVKADADKIVGILCKPKAVSNPIAEPAKVATPAPVPAPVVAAPAPKAESVKPPTPIRTAKPAMPAVKPIAAKPATTAAAKAPAKPVSRAS